MNRTIVKSRLFRKIKVTKPNLKKPLKFQVLNNNVIDNPVLKKTVLASEEFIKEIIIPKEFDAEQLHVYVNNKDPIVIHKRGKKQLGFEDEVKRSFHLRIRFESDPEKIMSPIQPKYEKQCESYNEFAIGVAMIPIFIIFGCLFGK